MSGFFITLEGGEGSGKSTQAALLAKAFASAGLPLLTTREPGGTTGAEALRDLLLRENATLWDARAETLLFYAARLEHVTKLILPALEKNTHVLCDRFIDSTFVYQGIGKGIEQEWIARLHRLCLGDFAPQLTFIFDLAPEVGLQRAGTRTHDETRFERMGLDFHRKVREGFLARAKASPEHYAVIDAALPVKKIHHMILAVMAKRLHLTVEKQC